MHCAGLICAAAAVALLGGCTAEPNPAHAGFVTGLTNIFSGTYERREADLRTRADAADARAESERVRLTATEEERDSLIAQREELQANMSALNRRLQALRGNPNADQQAVARLEDQARRLTERIEQLRRTQLSIQQAREAVQQVRREQDALTSAVRRIE